MGAVKTKNLFPGICLLLLIISEVFWFSANRQKSLAQEQLGEAQQQVADLQSQLEALTNSGAANETAEDIRLHAENQDLPRLRSQIQQLQADNSKLLKELSAARETTGQRDEQLQEMEAQTEQSQADQQAQAEAQQQAIQQTITQERNACIANLRLIYAAKQAWALDKNKTDSDVPTEQDLLPYLKGGVFPVCPAGGIYTIGAVGVLPTCSIPGHVLPSQ
jgi:DNA repair exonuclease SbcCD ATPase subunit